MDKRKRNAHEMKSYNPVQPFQANSHLLNTGLEIRRI
jgi:hypothetical protein